MKQKTGRKLLSFLLTLVMVVGLLPGMGMTAYAAGGGTEVTQANVICQQYSYYDADRYSGGVLNDTPPADITNITLADAQAFGAAVNCPTTYWVVVYAKDGDNLKWTSNGKTGEQTSTPFRTYSAWCELYNGDVFRIGGNCDPNQQVTFYFSKGLATVSVTGVSLDKTTAQTIDVDGKVSFTATVSPDNATDKTVKWSVGGTDAGAVKLCSDEACTTEVGTDATDKLTVYAKGMSAGTATVTVTATNGTDDTADDKSASCNVTVNPVTYEVTYQVVNGTWSDGSKADKKETVQSGAKPASVPIGMKASSGYTGGAWDTDPASATITGAKKFIFTFTAKQAATVTKVPEAKALTYNGSAQVLVTAGEATGGEMQYALGTKDAATEEYATSIPTGTDVGTYYVWYKAKGDANHSDSAADCVTAEIVEKSEPDVVYGIQALSNTSVELEEGGTEALKVQVYKITGDTETEIVEDIKVVWKTEDNDIVTLASKGDYAVECDVTAVKAGTATVTASILNDTYSVAFDVTVTAKTAPSYYDGVSETYYKITLAESEGGRLTASRATAPKGAAVTVTATPDAGFKAETPAVKDKDGKEIPVTQNTDGTWSFTMPGSDVTVTGGFVPEKAPLKFVDVPEDAWYYNDVYWAAENGVALGTDDTHFSPDGDCTRGQFVTFLWRAAGQPAPTGTENPFEDVKPGDYCYEAVLWAVENGITDGVDEPHFAPAAPLTRAHAVTFLYRYEQSVGKGFTGLWAFRLDYPDVSDVPDWAYEAFCWMTMEGIVRGSDGKLLPDALCPRCQVVALLARVFAA